ncbi:hypothetical protein COLO4_15287 [Corchorus olitorius]|uniref:Uncharacterized protein n=1 Tax=Corchorus olitorius TaxID=93759 RepID=A0A1R3JNR3_9ROSI|nr:hypothetical protein COLO4_15287 [Corchorus olitorius]
MNLNKFNSEGFNKAVSKLLGEDGTPNHVVERPAGGYERVRKSTACDFVELFRGNNNLPTKALKRQGRLLGVFYAQCPYQSLWMPTMTMKLPLNCLKIMITTEMCNRALWRLPKDLLHLLYHIRDFISFWTRDAPQYVLNHPSCWSDLKFCKVLLSIRSLIRSARARKVLEKAVGNAYPAPGGFLWKRAFIDGFLNNPNYPEDYFKDAAYDTFYFGYEDSTDEMATSFEDTGVGFLIYLRDLVERPRKNSRLRRIRMLVNWMSPTLLIFERW